MFAPTGDTRRKIVVATNVAEASVTIPDIVYVVDCGFVKMPHYSPQTNIESLSVCLAALPSIAPVAAVTLN